MQARMSDPAMIVPGAMQVLQTLGKSVKRGGVPLQTLDLVHLHATQINGAASALTCTLANSSLTAT